MKMIYNGTPIKSMNIKHYELSTNDCDMVASDLQAGKTAVARGRKITGTGKSFEFASYGAVITNQQDFVPASINVIEITSLEHPVKSLIALNSMQDMDFSNGQTIAVVVIDGIEYPITVVCEGNIMTLNCEKIITLESFYGRDNYYG